MHRPDTLAGVAVAAKDGNDRMRIALAGFLDGFYVRVADRQGMIDVAPAITADRFVDAYLGAIGEHLARRWELRVPAWTDDRRRVLDKPVFAGGLEPMKALLLAQSPLAFRRRMIFVEHEPLRRARMPR